MARWPAPGRCKRRLAADMRSELRLHHSDERSARLQTRLTDHTIAVARAFYRQAKVTPVLAVSGLGPGQARRWGQHHGIDEIHLQGQGHLGTRLKRQLLRQRHRRSSVLVVGSDLPDFAFKTKLGAGKGQRAAPLACTCLSGELADAFLGVVPNLGHGRIGFV